MLSLLVFAYAIGVVAAIEENTNERALAFQAQMQVGRDASLARCLLTASLAYCLTCCLTCLLLACCLTCLLPYILTAGAYHFLSTSGWYSPTTS